MSTEASSFSSETYSGESFITLCTSDCITFHNQELTKSGFEGYFHIGSEKTVQVEIKEGVKISKIHSFTPEPSTITVPIYDEDGKVLYSYTPGPVSEPPFSTILLTVSVPNSHELVQILGPGGCFPNLCQKIKTETQFFVASNSSQSSDFTLLRFKLDNNQTIVVNNTVKDSKERLKLPVEYFYNSEFSQQFIGKEAKLNLNFIGVVRVHKKRFPKVVASFELADSNLFNNLRDFVTVEEDGCLNQDVQDTLDSLNTIIA